MQELNYTKSVPSPQGALVGLALQIKISNTYKSVEFFSNFQKSSHTTEDFLATVLQSISPENEVLGVMRVHIQS